MAKMNTSFSTNQFQTQNTGSGPSIGTGSGGPKVSSGDKTPSRATSPTQIPARGSRLGQRFSRNTSRASSGSGARVRSGRRV